MKCLMRMYSREIRKQNNDTKIIRENYMTSFSEDDSYRDDDEGEYDIQKSKETQMLTWKIRT